MFDPLVPRTTGCKICPGQARLFGLADLAKNCEEPQGLFLPLTGVPVYYHRCPECGFLFTRAMDHFSPRDFLSVIYNDEYPRVDPDPLTRNVSVARLVDGLFSPFKEHITLLDHGCGSGLLGDLLSNQGYQVTGLDHFNPRFPAPDPSRRFSVLTSVEVLEHVPDPVALAGEMTRWLDPDHGIILLSTLLQPEDMEACGLSWWYASPRNGHVGLHTASSLSLLFGRFGFRVHSLGPGIHLAYRTRPFFLPALPGAGQGG